MDKQQPRQQITKEPTTRYDAAPAPAESWQEQAQERRERGFPTFTAHFDDSERWRK